MRKRARNQDAEFVRHGFSIHEPDEEPQDPEVLAWEEVAIWISCLECDALPGDKCRGKDGMHASRIRSAKEEEI